VRLRNVTTAMENSMEAPQKNERETYRGWDPAIQKKN
jgi:hypothetical protein